jgi:adenylate cyclase
VKFEIGHVLFIDIVGYSKLRIDEQKDWLRSLTDIVLATAQVCEATNEQLVRLPTGDGMALVFRNSSEEPVRCALEIAEAVQKNAGSTETPQLRLRMGVHSGPVSEVNDVSGRTNIAGAGINMAQRVMDCGDAGHILVSKHVADDLEHYPRWNDYLHSLGECEVKHGVRIGVVNLYSDEVGNPQVPTKFQALKKRHAQLRWGITLATVFLLGGIVAAFIIISKKPSQSTLAASGKSVAVLPFVNMSADKNDEYLSDGMTEELINALATVPGMRVPGRTSCFAFKGKTEEDIFRKVAEQLHVNSVLEGSVRKVGDKVRITAQLINVADGYHLWSEDYDRDMKDILAVESDVAQRVVEALKIKLGVDESRALTKKATENPEAHRLYLLGRYHTTKYTQADLAEADRYYEQALELDPDYALAYCGLADNYGLNGGNAMPGKEAWAKEKMLAKKALALDPELAEAHLSLGVALANTFDWPGAEQELNRALALNPNLTLAYDASAWVYTVSGRFDQAIADEKKGLTLDPLNPFLNDGLGWHLYWAQRLDESMQQLRSTAELYPNDAFCHFVLGWCLLEQGNVSQAKAELEKATKLDDLPWYIGWLGYAYAVSGDRAKAEQIVENLNELAKRRYVTPNARVPVYLGLGDKEKVLDGLEKSYEEQDGVCWQLKIDRRYNGLRNDPRFQAILKKVNLE